MLKLDKIQKELLKEVSDLHQTPAGAYNIRSNSTSAGRVSTANIEIIPRKDGQGLTIHVKPETKNESVHIPVVMTKSGLTEMVYNDFYIGENGCIIADADSRKDGHAPAYPHIVADGHRLCPFAAAVPFHRVRAVAGGVDADIRADEAVVAYRYWGLVKYREIEIGEETFPHADLLPVIAVKRLVYNDIIVSDIPKQPLQDGQPFFCR